MTKKLTNDDADYLAQYVDGVERTKLPAERLAKDYEDSGNLNDAWMPSDVC